MDLNESVQWQRVTCRDCKRTYQCTPEDDYYGATTVDDGQCFGCLLIANGMQPDTTPVLVIDETYAEVDPRDLDDQDAYEHWRSS
jgi:hypothetical protein